MNVFPAEVERQCRIYFLLPNSVHDLLQAESSEMNYIDLEDAIRFTFLSQVLTWERSRVSR